MHPRHLALALLGVLAAVGLVQFTPATAQPTASTVYLPALSVSEGGVCTLDPDPASALNTPLTFVTVREVPTLYEVIELENLTDTPIDVAGWTVCSINGNERIPIPSPALIIPNSQYGFPSGPPGTDLWDDAERDDAALYDRFGNLIAYWVDEE